MQSLSYEDYMQTPFGWLKVIADERTIQNIILTDDEGVSNPNDLTDQAIEQLGEYFLNKRKKFDLKLNLNGDSFNDKTLRTVLKIPFGKTLSYKEVAKKAGSPKAYRAVGSAMANNPFAFVVPCHRVVTSSGTMGGYFYGIDVKEKLLKMEGVSDIKARP